MTTSVRWRRASSSALIDLPKLSTGSGANVPLRGIEPETLKVRDEAKLVEGRMFRFGMNEVIAGRSASRHFAGLSLGSEVKTGQVGWTVVGFFETGGSVSETELWCDARVLQGVYRRGNSFQSVLARLTSPESFNTFKDWLTSNPQLNISVNPEIEYYTEQSTTITTLIRTIGFGIAALMGIGADIRRCLDDAYGGGHAHEGDRDASCARLQHVLGSAFGTRRVARPGGRRRCARRPPRAFRLQRVSSLDDELADVQPGRVRVCGDAVPPRSGRRLCAHYGIHRRAAAGGEGRTSSHLARPFGNSDAITFLPRYAVGPRPSQSFANLKRNV